MSSHWSVGRSQPQSGLDKMNNTAFFYGTLMAPQVLYRVIYGTPDPSPLIHPSMNMLKILPAVLHDHRRYRVLGCDYPGVVPSKGGSVQGTVVSGLTEGDVLRLDIFEGSQYERQTVKVSVQSSHADTKSQQQASEEVVAQTYIWTDDLSELQQEEWDFEDFKKRKMRAWMGLSSSADSASEVKMDEGFNDVDRAQVAANPTNDLEDGMGGRGVHGNIGRQLVEE